MRILLAYKVGTAVCSARRGGTIAAIKTGAYKLTLN